MNSYSMALNAFRLKEFVQLVNQEWVITRCSEIDIPKMTWAVIAIKSTSNTPIFKVKLYLLVLTGLCDQMETLLMLYHKYHHWLDCLNDQRLLGSKFASHSTSQFPILCRN